MSVKSPPEAAQPRLVLQLPTGAQQAVRLVGPVVVGRGAQADLRLEFVGVSRRHARLTGDGDEWMVTDLHSHNGTLVNGTRITESRRLQDGDELLLGPVSAVFELATAHRPGAHLEELGILGTGSTADVLRVRDTRTGRLMAMKRLRSGPASNRAMRTRFLREVRLVCCLEHAGIPPIYEMGETQDGRPWFTMRELRGHRLGLLIELLHAGEPTSRDGTWTLRRLIRIWLRVCDAVGWAHAHGIIHRDLKPDNIVVGRHGDVLVVDWGLARRVDDGRSHPRSIDPHPTREGEVLGTPAYMAPEQARGDAHLDARTDVYALGALLYAILAGAPPFEGGPAGILAALIGGAEPDPEPLGGSPLVLRRLAMQCLATDPANRPSDAHALAVLVNAWLDAG